MSQETVFKCLKDFKYSAGRGVLFFIKGEYYKDYSESTRELIHMYDKYTKPIEEGHHCPEGYILKDNFGTVDIVDFKSIEDNFEVVDLNNYVGAPGSKEYIPPMGKQLELPFDKKDS